MTGERKPTARDISDEAADWILRIEDGPLSQEDEAAFERWRSADVAHEQALAHLTRLWRELDAVHLDRRRGPPARRSFRGQRGYPRRSGVRGSARRQVGVIAASIAIAVLGASQYQTLALMLQADHATGVGERRTIALADGSSVELDSDTAIAVDFDRGERLVTLMSGRAAFDVAPSAGHPFVVEANGGRTTALGTAFTVERTSKGGRVIVTEHRVATRLTGSPSRPVTLGEGRSVTYDAGGVRSPMPVDVAREAAWRRGKLVVVNRPLKDVASEIGRYRRGWIIVSKSAASLRVSGVYDLDRPEQALDALQSTMGLTSYRLTDRLILLR